MNVIKTAIQRPVTVSMFVIAIILFGIVSLDRMAVNLLPDISYPSLTIQTDYSDAAPEEVESLVTRPIEEAVGVVAGLNRIGSVSRSGQSEVILEFAWDTDMNLASLDVREKLDFVTLPRDVGKPSILRFDPTYDPIMRLRLVGDESLSQLRYRAEHDLKKALESTSGVAAIKVIGGVEEQIHVEIDEKKLAELGIPITEVSQVLAQENLNQAAGSLYDLDANYLVRMLNQFTSIQEIREIVVRNEAGRRIVLGEIARVWRGARERTIIARLNGQPSVELAIYKEGDANTVEQLQYEIVFNQADFISQSVSNILSAALFGGLLATLVVFLFLRDLRSTLTISFSIPISIMAAFSLMYQTDISLNIMSLGGVALGVGMLVDNSIVVLESVHRHRRKANSLTAAVYAGTREVSMAVTASTITTVAVFLPLIFVEGIAGQLFTDQALTITYSLLASLLVALTVIPMVLAFQVRQSPEPEEELSEKDQEVQDLAGPESRKAAFLLLLGGWLRNTFRLLFVDLAVVLLTDLRQLLRFLGFGLLRVLDPLLSRFGSAFERVSEAYPGLLKRVLDHKLPVLAALLLLVALAAVASSQLGAELIPPLAQGEFSFQVRLPEGRPLEATDCVLQGLEKRVAGYDNVRTVFSSVGGSTRNQFSKDARGENFGQLYVVMRDQNQATEAEVIERIRSELNQLPEVNYTFSRPTLFTFRTPVEIEIYAYDLEVLRRVAQSVAARLSRIDGLSDIKTSTEAGSPELQIRFDRNRLARLGLDESRISSILKNKIRGDVATRYREDDRQIEVLVRTSEADRNSIEDIRNLVVNETNNPQGQNSLSGTSDTPTTLVPIRLSSVADIQLGIGPAEIRRIRSQRAAIVTANLSGRPLSRVAQEIETALQGLRADVGAVATMVLAGQNEELASSSRSLIFALGLAVFLVYLVMASQFESLVHPFIILFTVPLGLVGVILSLYVTGTVISVMVFLGVIVLSGIVVNNAIFLIDYTNQLRRSSMTQRRALLEAARVRLRPIVMTTLTTVLGLIPMALSWGEGAEIRAPMAIAVIGGLSFSTLLTLFLIPVVYEILDCRGLQSLSAESEINTSRTLPGGARV